MPGNDEFDSDQFELLQRRLSDQVETNLRARLFRFYAAIGTTAVVVAGFAGWSIIAESKRNVEAELTRQLKDANDTLQATLQKIDTQIAKADAAREVSQTQLAKMQEAVDDATPAVEKLRSFSAKVEAIDAQLQDLSSGIEKSRQSINSLNELQAQVINLASQLGKLAESQPAGANAAVSGAANTIVADVQKSNETLQQISAANTVFMQFNGLTRDQAESIAELIKPAGFLFPGLDEEQMPAAGLSEVRYYHDSDATRAADLAKVAEAAVNGLEIKTALPVSVRSYVDWPKAKPKPGTLELWIGLPQQP